MSAAAAGVERLDALAHQLRHECPWDRAQDERSIVPHTIEEAYELADAVDAGDDAKLREELGDVLFQVCFLSLLLEERGAGDLERVAQDCVTKLVRRHPHVFGDAVAREPEDVRRAWEEIKRTQEGRGAAGIFGDVPENLPALLYAAKALRRARSRGAAEGDAPPPPLGDAIEHFERTAGSAAAENAVGELLFATVAHAVALDVDPELALRRATARYRERVLSAAGEGVR